MEKEYGKKGSSSLLQNQAKNKEDVFLTSMSKDYGTYTEIITDDHCPIVVLENYEDLERQNYNCVVATSLEKIYKIINIGLVLCDKQGNIILKKEEEYYNYPNSHLKKIPFLINPKEELSKNIEVYVDYNGKSSELCLNNISNENIIHIEKRHQIIEETYQIDDYLTKIDNKNNSFIKEEDENTIYLVAIYHIDGIFTEIISKNNYSNFEIVKFEDILSKQSNAPNRLREVTKSIATYLSDKKAKLETQKKEILEKRKLAYQTT